MLVGAFSSNAYGVPPATKDADSVVEFKDVSVAEFCGHLNPGFSLDRQMMLEGFEGSTRNFVTHVESGFDIELFRLGKAPHHQKRFARKQRHIIPELPYAANLRR